jgi:hypothetical protein
MSGDGLERELGPEASRVLGQWSAQRGLRHVLERSFSNGGTAATVIVVDRHDSLRRRSQKLVLKLDEVARSDFGQTEYARHYAAALESPDFARDHLARLIDDPIPVGDRHWITFQSIAGSLDQFDVLSSLHSGFLGRTDLLCDADSFAAICGGIIRGVLADWAGAPSVEYFSVPDYIRAHLTYRLGPGKPLAELLRSGADDVLTLLRDESLTSGITIAAPVGRSHGDLHVENVLVRLRPQAARDDYRLIDLANHELAAPLARDPAHLLLHMVNRSLQWLGPGEREALREVLLDPASRRADQLPSWLGKTISGIYQAGEEWIEESGFGPDWRRNRPLSVYAAALMVYVRRSTQPDERAWLASLAADAVQRFLDSAEGTRQAVMPGRGDLPARPPERPRRLDPAPLRSTEKLIVGRTAEVSMFDRLIGGRDRQRLLNIYGPGGIGKSEVCRKLFTRARQDNVLVSAADVSMHGGGPITMLRELASSVATPGPDDVFGGLLERLDAYDAVGALIGGNGGLDAMFEVTGTPREPAALDAQLRGATATLPADVQQALRNRFGLDRYLRTSEHLFTVMFGDLAGEALDGRGGVLLLDTYEDARSLDKWVRTVLIPALPAEMKVVILGRNVLARQNIDWADHGEAIITWALPELAEAEARAYLSHYGLTDPATQSQVYQVTGGYPLLLVLVRQLAEESGSWAALDGMERSADRDLIASQLLERILREERVREVRDVLEKCAIASWINPEIIKALLNVSEGEARALFEKVRGHSFMERHPEGLRLHEKIRTLLTERLRFTSQDEYDRLEEKLIAHHAEKSSGLRRPDE